MFPLGALLGPGLTAGTQIASGYEAGAADSAMKRQKSILEQIELGRQREQDDIARERHGAFMLSQGFTPTDQMGTGETAAGGSTPSSPRAAGIDGAIPSPVSPSSPGSVGSSQAPAGLESSVLPPTRGMPHDPSQRTAAGQTAGNTLAAAIATPTTPQSAAPTIETPSPSSASPKRYGARVGNWVEDNLSEEKQDAAAKRRDVESQIAERTAMAGWYGQKPTMAADANKTKVDVANIGAASRLSSAQVRAAATKFSATARAENKGGVMTHYQKHRAAIKLAEDKAPGYKFTGNISDESYLQALDEIEAADAQMSGAPPKPLAPRGKNLLNGTAVGDVNLQTDTDMVPADPATGAPAQTKADRAKFNAWLAQKKKTP